MTRILIVDDDKISLKVLQRILHRVNDYEIDAFLCPLTALASVRCKTYDLVIADYQMPDMDGIALLREIKQIQPEAARIVLSGQCNRQSLYGAINEANALRYVEKPCDGKALLKIVDDVLRDRRRHHTPTVQELLGVIRDMDAIIQEQTRQIAALRRQEQEAKVTRGEEHEAPHSSHTVGQRA